MKVKVLHRFHDKADFKMVYLVGETYTFDDARAEYLIGRGLVEEVVEKPSKPSIDVEIAQPLFPAEKAIKPVTRRKSATKDN